MAAVFKKYIIFCVFILFSILFPISVHAEDFTADYDVQYFLSENADNVTSRVKFRIQIVNIRSDVYVKKFAISFPRTFYIKDITAVDDHGPIQPVITEEDKSNRIELEFSNPNTGKNSVNNFNLEFMQDNLFKVNGNVWEVILPTIENKDDATYKVTVNLPDTSNRKLSISKPNPDHVSAKQIIWNNPSTKTIYAVFGESQYYLSELNYHLKNPKVVPVYTDITFPPDTEYQKIYINSIQPAPSSVSMDEDGNYLGRYYLAPKETKDIVFKGVIEVFAKPRENMIEVSRANLKSQKPYLLNENTYWKLSESSLTKIADLDRPRDIYSFVTEALTYNYKKLGRAEERIGADAALKNPTQAVCTEFSDLFVSIAREKGIFAREIQGYAFSQDSELRPISLVSDVLHSWPEYYDPNYNTWVRIDPTWENTSGIDYFSSFDLNHVVFAIHGKQADYPLPAGMFKLENSQDILIRPVSSAPEEKVDVSIESTNFANQINDSKEYSSKITIKNDSNVFLTQVPIDVQSEELVVSPEKSIIPIIAPYEKKQITISYRSKNKNVKKAALLTVSLFGQSLYTAKLSIFPYFYEVALYGIYALLALAFFLFIFLKVRKRRVRNSL